MSQDSQKYEQVNPKQARSGWETEHTLGGPVATFGVDRAAVGVRLVRRRRGDLLLPSGRLLPASRAPKSRSKTWSKSTTTTKTEVCRLASRERTAQGRWSIAPGRAG